MTDDNPDFGDRDRVSGETRNSQFTRGSTKGRHRQNPIGNQPSATALS